jgi:hypothetical protein
MKGRDVLDRCWLVEAYSSRDVAKKRLGVSKGCSTSAAWTTEP